MVSIRVPGNLCSFTPERIGPSNRSINAHLYTFWTCSKISLKLLLMSGELYGHTWTHKALADAVQPLSSLLWTLQLRAWEAPACLCNHTVNPLLTTILSNAKQLKFNLYSINIGLVYLSIIFIFQ